MITVLVVDDEPAVLTPLRAATKAHGHEVITAVEVRQAIETSARSQPDVAAFDLELPGSRHDGIEVVRRGRAWSRAPIIDVPGRRETTRKIDALDAGAHDHLTDPCGIDELLARIRAHTRRGPPQPVTVGGRIVDLHGHRVVTAPAFDDEAPGDVHPTATEWSLLELLVSGPGRLVRRGRRLQAIRRPDARTDTTCLRPYLAQIRRRLGPDRARPRSLLTELGVGYRSRPGHPADVHSNMADLVSVLLSLAVGIKLIDLLAHHPRGPVTVMSSLSPTVRQHWAPLRLLLVLSVVLEPDMARQQLGG